MIEKTVYEAEDGQVFDTKGACLKYEIKAALKDGLDEYLTNEEGELERDYSAEGYILSNIDEINRIINVAREKPEFKPTKDGIAIPVIGSGSF